MLVSTCFPDTILDVGDTAVNKNWQNTCRERAHILVRGDDKQ